MSDTPKNSGTDLNIGITAGIGFLGLLAIPALGPGLAFLTFGTAFLQGFGSSMKLQGEIDDELNRQQAICEQITFSKDQLDKINIAIDIASQTSLDEDELNKQIGDMADSLKAQILTLKNMKNSFMKKLLINIVIYIVIVAILILIIISKKGT